MPKYKVSYTEATYYVTLVDAEDEDEAYEKAMEQLDSPNKTKKSYDQYSENWIVEVPAETKLENVQPEFHGE